MIRVSSDVERDESENRRELVVACRDMNVGYDVWVKDVKEEVKVYYWVARDCGVDVRDSRCDLGSSARKVASGVIA